MVAACALSCWLVMHPRGNQRRGQQLVAVGMLLITLFPAISITDDLWAAHHPAEPDVVLRRRPDGAVHAGIVPQGAMAFGGQQFQPPVWDLVEYAPFCRNESRPHEAPAHLCPFIRPPPVL